MRHAILIAAYRDFDNLLRLVHGFDSRFDIYIHIDKHTLMDDAHRQMLQSVSNVRCVGQAVAVNWAARSHVDAILWLCRQAVQGSPEAECFHLVSGADMLVRHPDELLDFFASHKESNFLENFRLPTTHWSSGGFQRLEFRHPLDRLNARDSWGGLVYHRYLVWQMRNGLVRSLPDFQVYGGSNWWSLTREAVAYVCDNWNWNGWYDRLCDTFAPDEMYVQTLIMNSPLRHTVVNDNLRYVLWQTRHGQCPAVLDESDYERIVESKAFFARKIDSGYSAALIGMLN